MSAANASFNLVDEPWIPARNHDGRSGEYSLREVLLEAHRLRGLNESSPLATIAITRVLLAVLHRAHAGPRDEGHWVKLWRNGCFDHDIVDAYLDRWRPRFDLFDPERPFMQVPFIPELSKPGDLKPVSTLFIESASGNNATLFDHAWDADPPTISPASAARAVITRHAYSIGFGKSHPFYFKDGPLTRGYAVLVEGKSFFETLVLNLQAYGPEAPAGLHWRAKSEDGPAWERDVWPEPDEAGNAPLGWTDLLTWQSRQIHLIPEKDGVGVRRCQMRQRYALPKDVIDPMKGYRQNQDGQFYPVSFKADRALWRDSHVLTARTEGRRPEILEWIPRIDEELRIESVPAIGLTPIVVGGMTTADGKAASVSFWRSERLPVPVAFLESDELAAILESVLATASNGERALTASMKVYARERLAVSGRPLETKDIDRVLHRLKADRHYWPQLEEPFQAKLISLAEDPGSDRRRQEIIVDWRVDVRQSVVEAFRTTLDASGSSGQELRAVAMSRAKLYRELAIVGLGYQSEHETVVQPEGDDDVSR